MSPSTAHNFALAINPKYLDMGPNTSLEMFPVLFE